MNKIQQAVLKQKIILLSKNREFKKAEATALQLLRVAPKDPELILSLAQLNENREEYVRSVEFYYHLSHLDVPLETKHYALEKAVEICIKQKLYKLGLVPSKALVKAKPNNTQALYSYGLFSYHTRHLLKAIEYLSKALNLDENNALCLNCLGLTYTQTGQSWKALSYFQKGIVADPDTGNVQGPVLFCYNYIDSVNEKVVSDAHKDFGRLLESRYSESIFSKPEIVGSKLRIGYLSPCFYWHSVSYFFKSTLEGSCRKKFEIFCYSDVSKSDDMTLILKSKCDHWLDTINYSDQQLFEQVKNDKIDILVDLTGYNADHRMKVFARRAAPIQVSYLGYPNTTGLSRVDYRLTDHWSDTEGVDEFYTEKLVRMASGFLCYYPDKSAPILSQLPAGKSNGNICFGSFNAFPKITQQVIKLWSKVLTRVNRSTLLIKAVPLHDDEFCNWVLDLFKKENISRQRIELLGWTQDKESHLKLYDRVDIHLDTFPYNGTTTTCEALWQGVPTITLAGEVHRERVGLSILSQLGLDGFIATSHEEYIEIAAKVANNLDELRTLRMGMRERMLKSPLMDVEFFSRELAQAYTMMYQHYLDT